MNSFISDDILAYEKIKVPRLSAQDLNNFFGKMLGGWNGQLIKSTFTTSFAKTSEVKKVSADKQNSPNNETLL